MIFSLVLGINEVQQTVYLYYIQKILARKSKLYSAFIDYGKAFDTIIHDAMWIKLIIARLNSKIITIIKAIYNKISASVKLSHDILSCFDICLGLK